MFTSAIVRRVVCIFSILFLLLLTKVSAHERLENRADAGEGPRKIESVPWRYPSISRVVTAGYPDSLGLFAFNRRKPYSITEIEGSSCVTANFLALDIDDSLAFDIDESVTLSLLIDSRENSSIYYGYDKNGQAEAVGQLPGPSTDNASRLQWVTAELDRARFIGRGMAGTDIAIATLETMLPPTELSDKASTTFTLCGVRITFPQAGAGELNPAPVQSLERVVIEFADKTSGQLHPVRLGLYDSDNRLILPVSGMQSIPYYETERSIFSLRSGVTPRQFWPHENRYYYYTAGSIDFDLAAGQYTLVASAGPEYPLVTRKFKVSAAATKQIAVPLERWSNPREQGWYSGDVHIHMNRESPGDNQGLATVLAAEDLAVSNLLEMGNFAGHHYPQYGFGNEGRYHKGELAIVAGVEAPRTARRGHVIGLNLAARPRFLQSEYFLYHKYLKEYRSQNGVTGYAHVGSEEFLASQGLALDVPWGLVDFVEVLQNSKLRTTLWYDFLNIGYPLSPAAGSDFPYFDQPGAVRSYVHLDEPFSDKAWFDGLRKGKTFVSNGPILSFQIGHASMGSTLANEERLVTVSGSAQIHPSYGTLQRLELVRCGTVVAASTTDKPAALLSLNSSVSLAEGGWYALRAYGNGALAAHTAAIFIESDSGMRALPCGKESKASLGRVMKSLENLDKAGFETDKELEYWGTQGMSKAFADQIPELRRRIEMTRKLYNN